MFRLRVDQQALANLFAQATPDQNEALSEAACSALLNTLTERPLTPQKIYSAVILTTQTISCGAARNNLSAADVEAMLSSALNGMDAALLQIAQTQVKSLHRSIEGGAGLHERSLATTMAAIKSLECDFVAAVTTAIQHAECSAQAPWTRALNALQQTGSRTGIWMSKNYWHMHRRCRSDAAP